MTGSWRDEIQYLGGSLKAEQALITQMEARVREAVRAAERLNGRPMRAQHAKMLAGVRGASFRVSGRLPRGLKVGFLQPGAEYAAHVRFSSASPLVARDGLPDLRGVAVRVVVGPNSSHDLLMTNAERHHARDAREAVATLAAFAGRGAVAGLLRLIARLGPVRALAVVSALREQMSTPVESLASETYWSPAPYAFGGTAVRFHLAPLIPKPPRPVSRKDLAVELKARLQREDIRFDFRVQRYNDAERTPLNDATRPWLSAHETVAELVLPRQELRPEDEAFVEALSFNPFHVSGPEFEPIGSMNRARARVYAVSAEMRR